MCKCIISLGTLFTPYIYNPDHNGNQLDDCRLCKRSECQSILLLAYTSPTPLIAKSFTAFHYGCYCGKCPDCSLRKCDNCFIANAKFRSLTFKTDNKKA